MTTTWMWTILRVTQPFAHLCSDSCSCITPADDMYIEWHSGHTFYRVWYAYHKKEKKNGMCSVFVWCLFDRSKYHGRNADTAADRYIESFWRCHWPNLLHCLW